MRYYHQISIFCVCLATFKITKACIKGFYIFFGNSFHQPKLDEQGNWAVITGATEEMGITFAEVLATKGINLILYGNSKEDLAELAHYLICRYGVQAIHFEVDFTQTRKIYQDIKKELDKYTIGVLINAAATRYYYPELFVDVPFTKVEYKQVYDHSTYTRIININILPLTHLSRIVIPGMIKRRRGIIINISSGLSTVPSPMFAVFSATKMYINKFSANLKAEYAQYGITILCLTPGLMTFQQKPYFWLSLVRPSPETYVLHAIRNLGIREQTYGYIPHSLIFYFLRILNYLSTYYTRKLMLNLALKIKTAADAFRLRNDDYKYLK